MPLVLRENLNRRLTIEEIDGNMLYLQNLALEGCVVSLNYENNNNATISVTASTIFVSNDAYDTMNLTLPTPSVGWRMTIIRTDNYNSENYANLYGSFFSGDSSYSLSYSGANVVIVYDGSVWHVLSSNNSD